MWAEAVTVVCCRQQRLAAFSLFPKITSTSVSMDDSNAAELDIQSSINIALRYPKAFRFVAIA
jgi:hypothetical protein